MARVIDDPSLERPPPAGHERATFPLPLSLFLSISWKSHECRGPPALYLENRVFRANILENLASFSLNIRTNFGSEKLFTPQDRSMERSVLDLCVEIEFFPKRISLSRLIYERRRLDKRKRNIYEYKSGSK